MDKWIVGLMPDIRKRAPITPSLQYSAVWMVPEVGIAPTSPPLQRGANLSQLFGDCGDGVLK